MAEARSARNVRDPISTALRMLVEEAIETRRRRDAEALERRAKIMSLPGGKSREAA